MSENRANGRSFACSDPWIYKTLTIYSRNCTRIRNWSRTHEELSRRDTIRNGHSNWLSGVSYPHTMRSQRYEGGTTTYTMLSQNVEVWAFRSSQSVEGELVQCVCWMSKMGQLRCDRRMTKESGTNYDALAEWRRKVGPTTMRSQSDEGTSHQLRCVSRVTKEGGTNYDALAEWRRKVGPATMRFQRDEGRWDQLRCDRRVDEGRWDQLRCVSRVTKEGGPTTMR